MCKLLSIIHFLLIEGNNDIEIHSRKTRVHDQDFMSNGVVQEWCRDFKGSQRDIHDEHDQVVQERQRFTITELSDDFPETSRSSIYTIITEQLGN